MYAGAGGRGLGSRGPVGQALRLRADGRGPAAGRPAGGGRQAAGSRQRAAQY